MNPASASARRLLVSVTLFAVVIVVSWLGYMIIQGWSPFDALYMTIATISTVGDSSHDLSTAGRLWTLGVIVFGVGVTGYVFLSVAGYLLEGHLFAAVGEQRIRARVRAMNDHYILCGFGRVGQSIARDLVAAQRTVVILDTNPASLDNAAKQGYAVVHGNPADVETLKAAGIERARGLVIATDQDAENVYVALSARMLRPDVYIIARANAQDSLAKLKLAGANNIISPYGIGGKRMAQLAMRPTAIEFLDTVLDAESKALSLEDFVVRDGSRLIGQPIKALFAISETIILALKRDDAMQFRPPHDTALRAGDELVVAGPSSSIRALEDALGRAR
ncbi:MAG TPA: potassium channel protein [Candidatus Baltobacteraceae bacterium]|jgi:voltage-gated potassium channel